MELQELKLLRKESFRWPNTKKENRSSCEIVCSVRSRESVVPEIWRTRASFAQSTLPREVVNVGLIPGLRQRNGRHDAVVTFACQLTKMAHLIAVNQPTGAEEWELFVREAVRSHGSATQW